MKKIIIAIVITGFVSLGISVFQNSNISLAESTKLLMKNSLSNSNFLDKTADKRLASWD
ncbi:hypothetical protein [Daejeonella sp. H1SJ63]|uniref:hypothetical protein n=1 Tax=Daejeonella sp. H1SJ63 TaxID=3034145 RepID=UPI0023EC6379|nr:hypothetical protein [Daejeonella sp. H1SJ63]